MGWKSAHFALKKLFHIDKYIQVNQLTYHMFQYGLQKKVFFYSILCRGDGQPEHLLGSISLLQSDLHREEHMLFAK